MTSSSVNPKRYFYNTEIMVILRRSMNSNPPLSKVFGNLPAEKKDTSSPSRSPLNGTRVHFAADETCLIAVAVPTKRPARHGSHVALGLLSDRFIFRFLHLHPSSSFTPFSSSTSPVAPSLLPFLFYLSSYHLLYHGLPFLVVFLPLSSSLVAPAI